MEPGKLIQTDRRVTNEINPNLYSYRIFKTAKYNFLSSEVNTDDEKISLCAVYKLEVLQMTAFISIKKKRISDVESECLVLSETS